MNSDRIKEHIRANAVELVRLHSRIHAAFKHRDESAKAYDDWREACAEMHKRYDNLAFPGSYAGALERIAADDPETIEAAICFLEVRPYFFRSGYMFKAILKRCSRATLSPKQAIRLEAVKAALAEWKRQKNSR